MKIVFIAPNSFGYIQCIIDSLNEYDGVEAQIINISEVKFKYSSVFQRVGNFFGKFLFNKNIKKKNRTNFVLKTLQDLDYQDFIVTIRPDLLEREFFLKLKNLCSHSYSFYFDAIFNIPSMASFISSFDKVYSYEMNDVKKYKLTFCTNYIYKKEILETSNIKISVFNVSSYDSRFKVLERFAEYFKNHNISYNIIVRKEHAKPHPFINMVENYISLDETISHIKEAQVLLDIQKVSQDGLSFRVFEALGFNKKLITTNLDIINYDFYNPDNILIVDISKPISIPQSFFNTPYVSISEDILYPYTLAGWIEKVFDIKKTS